jgi:hypothetical protein
MAPSSDTSGSANSSSSNAGSVGSGSATGGSGSGDSSSGSSGEAKASGVNKAKELPKTGGATPDRGRRGSPAGRRRPPDPQALPVAAEKHEAKARAGVSLHPSPPLHP